MRAIDADAFKDYIRGACEDMKHLFNDNGAVAKLITESFCKDIDEQPTIQPEPHWIPVTEQLPKKDGSYLVSGKWGSGKESVGDCEFSVEDGYFRTAWNFDVLAWRELPEPYKGVTE